MLRTTAALALLAFPAAAQDWPQFRGPDGLSVAADAPIPAAFGPDEHVLWKATVPAGHSSPCVVGNTIVLTGFEDGMDVVVAIERSTGKTLWSKSFESGPEGPYAHPDAKPALSTPVSDGEVVVAYFAGYGLIALELDGEVSPACSTATDAPGESGRSQRAKSASMRSVSSGSWGKASTGRTARRGAESMDAMYQARAPRIPRADLPPESESGKRVVVFQLAAWDLCYGDWGAVALP